MKRGTTEQEKGLQPGDRPSLAEGVCCAQGSASQALPPRRPQGGPGNGPSPPPTSLQDAVRPSTTGPSNNQEKKTACQTKPNQTNQRDDVANSPFERKTHKNRSANLEAWGLTASCVYIYF